MPPMATPEAFLPSNGDAPLTVATAPRFPTRPMRRLRIDPEIVVASVIRRAEAIRSDMDRGFWLDKRLQRYAKYRGIRTVEKTFPWSGCSDVDIPLLKIADLRANAGLSNTTQTMRPLVAAKATNEANREKEETITHLLDTQLFLDPGPEIAERRINDFGHNGLLDGNAVCYTPWVRDARTLTLTQYAPAIPPEAAPAEYLDALFRQLFPTLRDIFLDEKQDNLFQVEYTDPEQHPQTATIEVWTDPDGDLECVITKPATVYDGPVMLPLNLADVLMPTRCANLQPPADWNPNGAGYVFVHVPYRIDTIRRLKGKASGFNWLDEAGYQKILAAALGQAGVQSEKPSEELERQKDVAEGRERTPVDASYEEDWGHLEVECLMAFDRWDVDGDGVSEDVFFVLDEHSKTLMEARRLTEKWPNERPYRPLAEWCPLPVPNRWYGISFLELGEGLADLVKGTFDLSFDSWAVSTMPWFFYSLSSKLSPDTMRVAPMQGVGVPGDPRTAVYIPQFPGSNVSAGFSIIGSAVQFFQQVFSQGPLQFGQVPTGKATALRTMGTTQAILQQGDVRADQLLLNFFNGLRQVMRNFHLMNRRMLPPGKVIRLLGYDGPEAQAYKTIAMSDIDAECEFDFRPDFLNSNAAVLNQALQSVLGILVTPLMFQMGIMDAPRVYRLVKDFVRSLRLDHKLYLKPPTLNTLPPLLATEALDLILNAQQVQGVPLEGAQAHLQSLLEFMATDIYRGLDAERIALFRLWVEQVAQMAQQERMALAAQAFQQTMQSGGGQGQGGVMTPMQEPSMTMEQPQAMMEGVGT